MLMARFCGLAGSVPGRDSVGLTTRSGFLELANLSARCRCCIIRLAKTNPSAMASSSSMICAGIWELTCGGSCAGVENDSGGAR